MASRTNSNNTPQKYAPRQANGEAVESPIRGSTTPRGAAAPGASTPRSRFSSSPAGGVSPGGTTLFVSGMGSHQRRRTLDNSSHMFRSNTTVADAHIKDASLRVTPGPYAAARSTIGGNGTAAFRSKSPSDRDAHYRGLMASTYASPRSPNGSSNGRQSQLPNAAFRSASPTACAHIVALGKPVDASYDIDGRRSGSRNGSASFRSTTSIADAHIKASPKMHEGPQIAGRGLSDKSFTSPFKSTTSIADAHIKALTKPVDVVLAYRD